MEKEEFPSELIKILKDFINDIQNTFPEYKTLFTKNELEYLKDEPDINLLNNSRQYIQRDFDILYENEDMFSNENINTNFYEI